MSFEISMVFDLIRLGGGAHRRGDRLSLWQQTGCVLQSRC